MMNWLEVGLIGSVAFAFYYVQQMKMALKSNGLPVDMFTGWIADYRNLTSLIEKENDMMVKAGYQGILNGLRFSLAGTIVIACLLFLGY